MVLDGLVGRGRPGRPVQLSCGSRIEEGDDALAELVKLQSLAAGLGDDEGFLEVGSGRTVAVDMCAGELGVVAS